MRTAYDSHHLVALEEKENAMTTVLDAYDLYQEERPDIGLGELIGLSDAEGKILVIAPQHRCFMEWCNTVGISPNNRIVRYISEEHQMRGYAIDNTFMLYLCTGPGPGLARHNNRYLNILDYASYLKYSRGMEVRFDECIRSTARTN